MAALTQSQTDKVWTAFMDTYYRQTGKVCTITKSDFQTAVGAVNTWWDANVASASTALATNAAAFNTASTSSEKLAMFIYMLIVKYSLNNFIS